MEGDWKRRSFPSFVSNLHPSIGSVIVPDEHKHRSQYSHSSISIVCIVHYVKAGRFSFDFDASEVITRLLGINLNQCSALSTSTEVRRFASVPRISIRPSGLSLFSPLSSFSLSHTHRAVLVAQFETNNKASCVEGNFPREYCRLDVSKDNFAQCHCTVGKLYNKPIVERLGLARTTFQLHTFFAYCIRKRSIYFRQTFNLRFHWCLQKYR